jgi:flagellar assembly protein FliH
MSFQRVSLNPPAGAPNADKAAQAAADETAAQALRAELAALRSRAEAEGRAKGEAEGRADLQAQSETLRQAASALRAVGNQLAAPLADKEQDLADLVLDLAFELARHIVGVEVASSPASLKTLVTKLIQEAAAERGPKQSLVVRLNPADHALIEPLMMADNAHLLSDAKISRGGALVEVIAPNGDPIDKTEWDATIEGRIAAMRAALSLNGGVTEGAI